MIKTLLHKCELKFTLTSLHWKCDAPKLSELTEKKCYHGMTEFGHGINTQRWRCQSCDFDLCLKCVQHYAYTPIENIRESEVDYAYFLLTTNLYENHPKVYINRFINKEFAFKLFERVQIGALKQRACDDGKFGMLVHKKRIIARYGRRGKLDAFLENV